MSVAGKQPKQLTGGLDHDELCLPALSTAAPSTTRITTSIESVCDNYALRMEAQKLFRGGTVSLSKREEEAMNADTDLITREMHRRGLTSRIEQLDLESAASRRAGSLH
jgi:hypothetical protein